VTRGFNPQLSVLVTPAPATEFLHKGKNRKRWLESRLFHIFHKAFHNGGGKLLRGRFYREYYPYIFSENSHTILQEASEGARRYDKRGKPTDD
jgi:hypothetical protein